MLALPIKVIEETLLASGNHLSASGSYRGGKALPFTPRIAEVLKDSVFIAYRGVHFDGHEKITEAVAQGAAAVIYEDLKYKEACGGAAGFLVKDSRKAWAWLAAAACDHPQKQLKMIAVTGTNGKTSTVWLVKELLRAIGLPTIAIGTLGVWLGDEFIPGSHTTPDPDNLFPLLKQAVAKNIPYAAMEVSSHALVQEKLGPVLFDAAAFTSFSRDHLDFHKGMADYFAAKWRLVNEFLRPGAAFFLSRDVANDFLPKKLPAQVVLYGDDCPLRIKALELSLRGASVELSSGGDSQLGELAFFARHSLQNFLAAWLLVRQVTGQEVAAKLWSNLKPVPGRLEPVPGGTGKPAVFVDYAHTPDALEKTLRVLRPLTKGKLWVVFGCGGDRDRGKRPVMAEIAVSCADHVVVTSDNPRTEDPQKIIAGIMSSVKPGAMVRVETDREKAIALAIASGGASDVVLIAGKGHEDYQIIGTTKYPFDDRLVAAKYLTQVIG